MVRFQTAFGARARRRSLLGTTASLTALIASGAHAQTVVTSAAPTTVVTPATGTALVVTSGDIRGTVALNRFADFRVDTPDTVTMVLPTGTSHLVNLVDGTAGIRIDGTVTARLGDATGAVGGHLLFAAPGGIVIGNGAKVYAGRVSLVSADAGTLDAAYGATDPVARFLSADIAGGRAITVDGSIFAPGGVAMRAPTVTIGQAGVIRVGAGASGAFVAAGYVQTGGVADADRIVVGGDGAVDLVADTVRVAGDGTTGARIDAQALSYRDASDAPLVTTGGLRIAAADVALSAGSRVDASNAVVRIAVSQTSKPEGVIDALTQMPSATAKVTLDGFIEARSIDVTAKATATTAADEFTMPTLAADFLDLGSAFTGLQVAVAKVAATSTIAVGARASLTARDGNLSLAATSDATAEAKADSLATTGTAPLEFGFVYAELDSKASVSVAGTLAASGNLALTATNVATTEAEALTYGRGISGLSALVARETVSATVDVASTALLDAGGALRATAYNQEAFDAKAASYEVTGKDGVPPGAAGGAIVVALRAIDATATLGGTIGGAVAPSLIAVTAGSDSTHDVVEAATKIGDPPRAVEAKALVESALLQKLYDTFAGKTATKNSISDDAKPTDNLAAAVTLELTTQAASATIAPGAVVAGGAIDVSAKTRDGIKLADSDDLGDGDFNDGIVKNAATAEAAVKRQQGSTEASVSAAIAVGIKEYKAHAIVGEDAAIVAETLGVTADIARDYSAIGLVTIPDLDTDGAEAYAEDVAQGFFTNQASASAGDANGTGYAGSVGFNAIDADTRAWVDSGARLTLGADRAGRDALTVSATTLIEATQLLGKLKAGAVATGGEKAGGGALGVTLFTPVTIAGIADGVVVSTVGSVRIIAEATVASLNLATLSGKAKGLGVAGTFGSNVVIGETHATISNAATIDAAAVSVDAASHLDLWSTAGALAISTGDGSEKTQGSVGVSGAANVVELDTLAAIAANDGDDATGVRSTTRGHVAADTVSVASLTNGRIGTLSVAGAYSGSSSDSSPGTFTKLKAKAETAKAKVDSLRDAIPAALAKLTGQQSAKQNDVGGGGTPPTGAPTTGFGIAGSSSVTFTNADTRAIVRDATVTPRAAQGSGLKIAAAGDIDLYSVSGSGAISRAKAESAKTSTALAGAIGVQFTDNQVIADLRDSDVSGQRDVTVLAVTRGDRIAAGLGLSASFDNRSVESRALAASVTYSDAQDTAAASINGGSLTGTGAGALRVGALNSVEMGLGSGSVSYGGKQGVGVAVTIAKASGGADAKVTGAAIAGFNAATVLARNAAQVVSLGASIAVTSRDAATQFTGAGVYNDIDMDANATLDVSRGVSVDGAVNVIAGGSGSDGWLGLSTRASGAAKGADDYDVTREDLELGADQGTFDTAIGLGKAAFNPGARVIGLAGTVGKSKGTSGTSLGLNIAYNAVDNDSLAAITGVGTLAADRVTVASGDAADILSAAVGAALSEGTAAMGSLTVNRITGAVAASIGAADVTAGAGGVAVTAAATGNILSLAGQFVKGNKAGGAAVAYNELVRAGNNGSGVTADLDDTRIATPGDVVIGAVSDAAIRSAAAAGALASQGIALSGAATANVIQTQVAARATDADIDTARVRLIAKTTGEIDSLALGIAVGGSGGAGVSVAVNRIDPTVTASLSRSTVTATDVSVDALANSGIRTLAAGIGKAELAGAASVVVNLMNANVVAEIDGSSVVTTGTTAVMAEDLGTVDALAGSVAYSSSGAAAGITSTINRLAGSTIARVTASTVTAGNAGDGTRVNSGVLENTIPQSNSLAGFANGNMAQTKTPVNGVAVNAASGKRVRVAGGAISIGNVGVNASLGVNLINGATLATLDGSIVTATDGADVDVRASSNTVGVTAIASLAGGSGGAVAGAGSAEVYATKTEAVVRGGLVRADRLNVQAIAQQTIGSLAAGGGTGGSAAGLAGVGMNLGGLTSARVGGGVAIDTNALSVDARNTIGLIGGALGVAVASGVAGGASVVAILNDGVVEAIVGGTDRGGAASAANVTSGDVTIHAKADTELGLYGAAGGVALGGGAAGTGLAVVQKNATHATIQDAAIRSTGDVDVLADEVFKLNAISGALGVGLTGGGIGLGATIVSVQSDVAAQAIDSTITARTLDILARGDAAVDSQAWTAALGAVALSANAIYLQFGQSADSNAFFTDRTIGGTGSDNRSLTAIGNRAPTGNVSSADLSDTDRAAMGKVRGTAAAVKGATEHRVVAGVTGASTITADVVRVDSAQGLRTLTRAGNVAGGALLAAAGTVDLIRTYSNVGATVGSAARVTAKTLTIRAGADEYLPGETGERAGDLTVEYPVAPRRAAEGYSVLGTAGFVAGNVGYVDAKLENTISASFDGVARGSGGTLSVSAYDATDAGATTLGLTAGVVALNGSVAKASRDSTTAASLSGTVDGFATIEVKATDTGRVDALSVAGTGGVFGATAAYSEAINATDVSARLGGSANIAGGATTLTASVTPLVEAEALGVTVGAVALGASIARAEQKGTIAATVDAGATILGALTIDAKLSTVALDGPMVAASAIAGAGGALIGAVGTSATAINSTKVIASVGTAGAAPVTLGTGALTINAFRGSVVSADALGLAAGIVGVGANFANADGTGSVSATLGAADGSDRGDSNLTIAAKAGGGTRARAVAGSGGVVAGAGADARNTDNTSTTARFAAAPVDGKAFMAGTVEIEANSAANAYGSADTHVASVAGKSGAVVRNTIGTTTRAEMVDGAQLGANKVTIDARANTSTGPAGGYMIDGGSGGVFNDAAASARNDVTPTVVARVGDAARIVQRNAAGVDAFAEGRGVSIDASNVHVGAAKVRLDAGSFIASPRAELTNTVALTTRTLIGDGAWIDAQQSIGIGNVARTSLDADVYSKVSGAAGYVEGAAYNNVTANQTTEIGDGAWIESLGDVRIGAGTGSDGADKNAFAAKAEAQVYNWTFADLNTDADATSYGTIANDLSLGTGSTIRSARDVKLFADRDGGDFTGHYEKQSTYLKVAGFFADVIDTVFGTDIGFSSLGTGGEGKLIGNGTLRLLGDVEVTAGMLAKRSLSVTGGDVVAGGIDLDGSTQSPWDDATVRLDGNLKYLFADRIAALKANMARSPEEDYMLSTLDIDDARNTTVSALFAQSGNLVITAPVIAASGAQNRVAANRAAVSLTDTRGFNLVVGGVTIPDHDGGLIRWSGGTTLPSTALTATQDSADGRAALTIVSNSSFRSNVLIGGAIAGTSTDYHVTVANGDYLQFAGVDVRSYGANIPNGVFFAQLSTPFQQNNPIDGWKGAGISLRDGPNKLGAAEAANIVAYQDYFRSASHVLTSGTNNDLENALFIYYLLNDLPSSNQDQVLGPNTIRVWSENYKDGWGPVYPGDKRGEGQGDSTGDGFGFKLRYIPGGVADWFRKITLPTKLFGSLSAPNASSRYDATFNEFVLKGAAPASTPLPASAVIKANALFVDAPYINLSGRVELGRSTDYSVTIPVALDVAMGQIAANLHVEAGTQVRIKDYRNYLAAAGFPVATLDAPGSLLGDVRFVVGENRFVVDDISTGVAGVATFNGDIANTNSSGSAQLVLNDGQGKIDVRNDTAALVSLGKLSTTSTGAASVSFRGQKVSRGADGNLVLSGPDCTGLCIAPTVTGTSTATFEPYDTLRFRWTDKGVATRSFNFVPAPRAGFYDINKSSYTPWTWESITLDSAGLFGNIDSAQAASERAAGTAFTQTISGNLLSQASLVSPEGSPNYYPAGMRWLFPTKTDLTVQTTIRADYPIAISFVGNPTGAIDVKSSGALQFDGAVNNPTGLTTISGFGLTFGAAATIISGSLSISNFRGSIGAIDAPLAIKLADGGVLKAAASDWYARPADIAIATKGNTVVHSSRATGDVYLISKEGSLLGDPAAANGIAGNNVTLLAPLGSVGTAAKPLVMSYAYGRDAYYDPDGPSTGGGAGDTDRPDAIGILNASARDGIAITSEGPMRVGLVSAPNAPILLQSVGGDIVSSKAEEVFDPEAVARLAGAYDALKLRGSDADEANARVLTAFTNGFDRDQAEYRLLSAGLSDSSVRGAVAAQALAAVGADIALLNDVRAKASVAADVVTLDDAQAEGFREFARLRLGRSEDAGSALSTSQITAAVQGYFSEVGARVTAVIGRPAVYVPARLSAAQVDAFAQTRIAALEASFTDLFGETKPFTASGPEYVLDVKNDLNLRQVEFTRRDGTTGLQSRYDSLVQGATWRDEWLDVRIPGDALVPVSSTRLVNAAPDIVGGDITLIAQGNVGAFSPSIAIHYTGDSALLTDVEKAVIAAAGPGDIAIAPGLNNSIDFTVKRDRLLQIDSTGTLNVATQGRAFVGAKGDLPVGTIVAGDAIDGSQATNDVRLVASGSITATRADAGAYDIAGGALRIEAGDGAIGTADRPILLAVDRVESARAAGNLALAAIDTLRVGNVFAGGTLSLASKFGAIESIFDSAVVHIQANGGAAIDAFAGLGSAARPLQLAGGRYKLVSDYAGIYANAPTGSLDIVGPRFASDESFGIVSLGAAQNLKLTLAGDQRPLYRLDLTAGSGLTLGGDADLGLAIVTARAGDSLRTTGTLYLDQFDFAGISAAKPSVTIDGSLTMPFFALRNVGDVRINGEARGLFSFAIAAAGAFSTGRHAKVYVVGDDDYASGIAADRIEFAPTSRLEVAAGDAFLLDSSGMLNLGFTTGAGAIVARGDAIALRGRVLNGAFAADAAGALSVGADVRSGGAVSLKGATIMVDGDRMIAGERVSVSSPSELDTRGYYVRGGSGGVALTSDSAITASRIATPGTLTLHGSEITFAGPMAVGGIDAASTSVLRIDGSLHTTNSLILAAPIFSIASGAVLVSDRIALSSANAVDTTGYLLRGGAGGVAIASGGLLTLGRARTPGVLTLRGEDIVSTVNLATVNLSLGGVDAVAANTIALRKDLLVTGSASFAARDINIGAFHEIAARDLKIVTDSAIDMRIQNMRATNDLSLTSRDAITIDALTLTGNLLLRGREIALLGDLSVGGLDALTAGTLTIADGVTLSGQRVSLDSGSAIDATRFAIADGWDTLSLRSSGDVAIGATSGSGALRLRGANLRLADTVSAGSIDAETVGTATVSGDLRATDKLRMYAGDLAVADDRVLAGQAIDISSDTAIDALRYRLSGGANEITLRTLGDLSVGALASDRRVVLRGANLRLGGAIGGAAIDVAATGTLTFACDLTAQRDLRLRGTTITALRSLRLSGSEVDITGSALNADFVAIDGRNGVDITTTDALTIGDATTAGLLGLRGNAITTGALAAGTLDLVANGQLTTGTIDVRDDAALSGTALRLNGTARASNIRIDGTSLIAGDFVTTGTDTRITITDALAIGNAATPELLKLHGATITTGALAAGTLDLVATGQLTTGTIDVRDDATLSGSALTLNGAARARNITIDGTSLIAGDFATTGGDTRIATIDDVLIGAIEATGVANVRGAALSLGDVRGQSVDLDARSALTLRGDVTAQDLLEIDGGSMSVASGKSLTGGDVTIRVGAIEAADATIATTRGNPLTINTAGRLAIGTIDTNGDIDLSGEDVAIGAYDTQGNVALRGNQSVTIGDGRTLRNLAVTGGWVSATALAGDDVAVTGYGQVLIGALDASIARIVGRDVTIGTFGGTNPFGSLKVTAFGDFAVQRNGALTGDQIDISAQSILAEAARITARFARLDAMDSLYVGGLTGFRASLRAGGGVDRFFIPGLDVDHVEISYDSVPLASLIP